MSRIIVDSLRGNSASSDAITLANDGTCTANITNNLSNRNLIINGAMQVAQRGTSSTADDYGSVDRFKISYSGTDEAPTHAQVDVGSSDSPFTKGLTKALKITNGNQTSGAGSADRITFMTRLEAQDIRNSGWNYVSSSSYITLSFWVKSSVAQNFYVRLKTEDGTAQNFVFETGSLTADTWTKVSKTIAGNSNLTFDNDGNTGLEIEWNLFRGTDTTGSVSLDSWAAFDSSVRTPDNTSTWYTTNDATFEITGVQLEVGSVATDFEHRSYAQELALCQRYFQALSLHGLAASKVPYDSTFRVYVPFKQTMRAIPTITYPSISNFQPGGATGTASGANATVDGVLVSTGSNESNSNYIPNWVNDTSAIMKASSEL